eukprot:NODE_219_length_12440_cov_2.445588.p4 type:complete len:485 gc:universal NODE_219_length_12440_cov_2.445588:6322-7776(+)
MSDKIEVVNNEKENISLSKSKRQEFINQMNSLFEDGQNYVQVMKDLQSTIEEPKAKKVKKESSFDGTLMDFQELGLKFLYNSWMCGMNGILADDMGLGKTIQCLAFFAKLFDGNTMGRVLVICPSAVVYNWVSEAERFTPDIPVIMYLGNKAERKALFGKMPKDCILVTSYQIYMNDASVMNARRYNICVVDEAHRLKNHRCKLSTLMDGMIADDKILLTGTPLQNDIVELWSLLKFCLPNIFDKSFHIFEDWMEEIKDTKAKSKSELVFKMKKIIEPHLLRRIKKDVFPDMLNKKSFLVYCPMTKHQKHLYDSTSDGEKLKSCILEYLGSYDKLERTLKVAFGKIKAASETMRQLKICCHPFLYPVLDIKRPFELYEGSGKFCVLFQLLRNLFEDKENKVIIFTQFVDIIYLIGEACDSLDWKYSFLSGNTKLDEREIQIENFQNDPENRIFIATTRSGGLGLNLTSANHVVLYDLDWYNFII